MKILVYPKAENPYQDLLYTQPILNTKINYLDYPKNTTEFLLIFIKLIAYRQQKYNIFHIHWLYPFAPFSPFFNSIYFLFFLSMLKLLKYKLVWTVHNIKPHEKTFIDDNLFMKILAYLADAKIVHSKFNLDEMTKLRISIKNTHVIPIGNYINVYPNNSNKFNSYQKLNLKKTFTFLYFGLIRQYKGISLFIDASRDLLKENKNINIIIAGRLISTNEKHNLEEFKSEFPDQVKITTKHIPNNYIQYYFNAGDIVVLPFTTFTTSSTAVLAMSFKKPIIFPLMGNLAEIKTDIGFSFEPNNLDSLKKAMINALNERNLNKKGEEAFKYISKYKWDFIANKTLSIYMSL